MKLAKPALFFAAAMLGISCQNTQEVIVSETSQDPLTAQVVLYKNPVRPMDSLVKYWSPVDSGQVMASPVGTDSVSILLRLSHPLNADTMRIVYRSYGMTLFRGLYVQDGADPRLARVGIEQTPAEAMAYRLLYDLDTLRSKDSAQWGHRSDARDLQLARLKSAYAWELASGKVAFKGYPDTLPAGLDTTGVGSLALISASKSGQKLSELCKTWDLKLDSAQALALLRPLVDAGLIPETSPIVPWPPAPTVRIAKPIALTGDLRQGTTANLSGSLAWRKQTGSLVAVVLKAGQVANQVKFRLNRAIAGGDTSLDLAANATLAADLDADTGTYSLELHLTNGIDSVVAKADFRVLPRLLSTPKISRVLPLAQTGTVLENAQDSLEVQWSIANWRDVNKDSVFLDGASLRGLDDSTWRAKVWVPADSSLSTITFRVRGKNDSVATDFVLVRRRPDHQGPTLSWVTPAATVSVDASVSSVQARVRIVDRSGVGLVQVNGITMKRDTGSDYVAQVPLGAADGKATMLRVVALDLHSNATEDSSVSVIRSVPSGTDRPLFTLVEPKSASGNDLPFSVDSIHVSWKIMDLVPLDTTSVKINDAVATWGRDSSWSTWVHLLPDGQFHTITIQAANAKGTGGFDQILVRRAKDLEAPTIKPGTAHPTWVPFDTAKISFSWTLSDNHKITAVKWRGIPVATTSPFSAAESLVVGRNDFVLEVRDSTGNRTVDSFSIERRVDTVGAVTISDTNSKLRSGTFGVGLSCPTKGASIHYTLDGTEPTESSPVYQDSLRIDSTRTLRARAFANPRHPGPVSSVTYNMAVVVDVSGGGDHTLVLLSDGTLWGFGDNMYNAFAEGSKDVRTRPVKVLDSVVQMSAGNLYSLAVRADHSLWGIGRNENGQLGDGSNTNRSTWEPILRDVRKAVASWSFSTLILKLDGALLGTGSNEYGKLGVGDMNDLNTPQKIATDVVDMGCGAFNCYFLTQSGAYWTMGFPGFNSLGVYSDSVVKRPIKTMDSVQSISPGSGRPNLVGRTDGTLWAFGANVDGMFGTGDTTVLTKPGQVSVQGSVTQVALGELHSLVLTKDGSVWGAGNNDYGQLGNPSSRILQHVRVAEGGKKIACGYFSSFVIRQDGTLWGMGRNDVAQLGIGHFSQPGTLTRVRF